MDTERNVECLHWDGYRANLQTMVTHQLDRGLFCDITIVCEGGDTVKVHRIVLSTCSAFLNEIIADLPPYKEAAFILKDWKFRDVKLIVEFMYSGEICVERSRLHSVQELATILQIKGFDEAYQNHTDNPQPPSTPIGYNWSYQNCFSPASAPASQAPNSDGQTNQLAIAFTDSTAGMSRKRSGSPTFDSLDRMVKKSQSNSGTILTDADFWQKIMPTTEQRNSTERTSSIGYDVDVTNSFSASEQQPMNTAFWLAMESCLHAEVPTLVKMIMKASGYDSPTTLQEMNQCHVDDIEAYVNGTCSWPHYVRNLTIQIEDSYKRQQVFKFLPAHRSILLQMSAIAKSDVFKTQYQIYLRKSGANLNLNSTHDINASAHDLSLDIFMNGPSDESIAQLKRVLCEKVANFIGKKGGYNWSFTKECVNETMIKTFTIKEPNCPSNSTGQYFPECVAEIECPADSCKSAFKCFYREYIQGARNNPDYKQTWRKPCWHYQSFINHFSRHHSPGKRNSTSNEATHTDMSG